MNKTLWRWIAQSESWQTSVDLHIPTEEQSTYHFLPRYDDFYLSLMRNCINILDSTNLSINNEEVLLIAKGLEIFSLKGKQNNFQHIDRRNNMLFAAGLYYLAGYSSSSIILSSLYKDYDIPIDEFISNFLQKSFKSQNEFSQYLWHYLETGNNEILEILLKKIDELNEESYNTNIDIYISSLLAKRIINNLKNDNIWIDLLNIMDDKEFWKPYVLRCIKNEPAIINFFPSQREALKCGILSEKTMSLQMPTSAGKTYLSEIVIYNQIKILPESKVLYLTPYRALASELKKR